MSLNGLEDPKVKEAHEAAVAEPGGWFLLKYSSRDEVELLGRGNGGIVEVRNNVAEYEETSPLYGFLRYRRRSVLIKYLPEACSRLIQARVAVHFNAVCERFSPHDTIFEIAIARDLKDSKLSAACSLHAASGSNSSSTSSLRRRRLMEIAEEEEEEQRATKRQSVLQEDEERPQTRDDSDSPTAPVTLNSELAALPENTNFAAANTSELPNFLGIDERPMSPTDSVDAAGRISSQSSRADFYMYSSYPYGKPKVKLAPRPSADANGRPRTAGQFRPVSQIPSGLKLFGKGSKKAGKGKEDDAAASLTEGVETPAPTETIPTPEETQAEVDRPPTSSGVSTVSTIMPPPLATPAKPTITPEKARLMKAMKLRREKKQKMALKSCEASTASETPALNEDEERAEEKTDTDDSATEPDAGDSGIALDASSSSMNTDQASEGSHPASPMIASSELDQSTKASSLSESTDETVQAKGEDGLEKYEDDSSYYEESIEEARIVNTLSTISEKQAEVSIEEMPVHAVDEQDSDLDEESTAEGPETTMSFEEAPATASATENPSSIPAPSLSTFIEAETRRIPDTPETALAEDAVPINKDEEAPQSPPSPPLKVPKSKFSTQDLRSAAKNSEIPTINSPPTERSLRQGSPVIVTEEADPYEGGPDKQGSGAESQINPSKRRVFVEPIKTDFEHHHRPDSRSDAHFSDDESLMEELQSATVLEAKPMFVAKSPVTPVFPSPTKGGGGGSGSFPPHMIRTVSNPVRGTLLTPTDVTQSSARSLSGGAAYLHQVTQQRPPSRNLSSKVNMGSSISQRIKALEKLSAGTGETVSHIVRDRPSSTFFSVRKGREPSRSPSVADRANSFTRRTPPSRSGSRDPRDQSPERARQPRRERSGSVASRLSMFEPAGGPVDGHTPRAVSRGGPESISVTAKIVRDPNQCITKTMEPPKDPSEYNPVQLKQSPLLVDHQKATTPPVPQWTPLAIETKETIQERRMSKETRRSESRDARDEKSRRSSLSVVKDFIKDRRKSLTSPSSDALVAQSSSPASRSPTRPPSTHQNSSFTQRLSISSRRSSFSKDKEVTSPTTEGSASGDDKSEKKKASRAGRFMRRLSSLSGGRGKVSSPPTGISPTVKEEEAPAPTPKNAPPASTSPAAASPSIISYMGDVNVQFPDTLLWKRRNMCLDSQGFLILSAVPGGPTSRPTQSTKRYHLSEFRTPCIPDVEIQELPNSVVLDLIEGSGVQVACEDRHGQMSVLKILQEAHAGHATFGQ